MTNDSAAKLYINGSNTEWKAKTVGFTTSLTKGGSRRFDIEFRTQYAYSYDAENEIYVEHKISVPMLFVQEEMLDTLAADVLSQNKIVISIGVNDNDLDKITDDYKNLIPAFISDKNEVTVDFIIAFVGEKINFSEGDD